MKWVKLPKANLDDIQIRIDDDGLMRVICIAEHSEFVEWVAAGNELEIIES